jgi:hypothetical protein
MIRNVSVEIVNQGRKKGRTLIIPFWDADEDTR